MATPRFFSLEAKSGLSRGPSAEPFLCCLYRALAPYRGCLHGCAYCDGRAEKYYVEGTFDRDIGARFNLVDRMRSDVERGVADREYGAACIGSGVTDVYQPHEERFALTRKTLEALIPAGIPVVILPKNARILRDLDLLAQFPKALVILTITTLDARLASILEPGASPPERRLETVRRAREAGFRAGVMAMPLCPGLTDGEEEVRALVRACGDAGAEFVYPGGLTLRPGRQKDRFFETLSRHFPEKLPLYAEAYAENRQSGAPTAAFRTGLERAISRIVDDAGMPAMIPHGVYRDLLSLPDAVFVLLCHMQSLYAARGVNTAPLKAATERYAAWLAGERKALRRRRPTAERDRTGAPMDLRFDLDTASPTADTRPFPVTAALEARLKERPFAERCGNERLGALMDRIIAEGAIFDYRSLSPSSPAQ